MKEWNDFDVFESVIDSYVPSRGEGDTFASQIATAVNKLIYKWYNDGDVFDNSYNLSGWANNLSSYANWLYENVPETRGILLGIKVVTEAGDYEDLLFDLAVETLSVKFLKAHEVEKVGSIYYCEGMFKFELADDEEEEEEW